MALEHIKALVMPSADVSAKINPKIPLVWMGILCALFGIFMIVSPLGLLRQYGIVVSGLEKGDRNYVIRNRGHSLEGVSQSDETMGFSQSDEMMIASAIVQFGILYIMIAGCCLIACRNASEQTRMHLNVGCALSSTVNLFLSWAGFDAFTSLGASLGGLWFNVCLFASMMVLCCLGANRSCGRVSLRTPIYWGSLAMAILYLVYALMFFFLPETLLDNYHAMFEDDMARKLFLSILHYSWSGFFFGIGSFLLAGMFTTDLTYTYILNRWLAMAQFAMCIAGASNVAWWASKNEAGRLDAFILGQWLNCGYALALFALMYVPVLMVDKHIAHSVHKAIEGEQHSSVPPTLLAPLVAAK